LKFREVGEEFGINVEWNEDNRNGWFKNNNNLGNGIVNDMNVLEGQGLFTLSY
jgi:hypothetical protein